MRQSVKFKLNPLAPNGVSTSTEETIIVAGGGSSSSSTTSGTAGHIIEEDGTPLTQRAKLNFSTNITATDDPGGDETDITVPNATSSVSGVLKLTNDLGGTSDSPTVPGLVQAQISTLTTAGHSWTGASDTQAYYGANFGYTGIVARTLGLLGIHENNHTHLGTGASYLCRTSGVFGAPNCGWGGFMQYVIPFGHPLQGDATTLNDFTNMITQPSAFQLVHHINDLAIMGTSTTATGVSFITTAFQNALRAHISRARAGILYTSYYNSSAAITWDTAVITSVSGFSSTAQTGSNTGVAVYRSTANGNTVTLTVPSNFTGGYFVVQFLANNQAQTTLTDGDTTTGGTQNMNATDVTTQIAVAVGTDFANNDIIQMYSGGVASGELMKITAGGGTTNLTVTRGFNSTTKTTHAVGDEIYKRNDATINFSGTASTATGSIDVGSIALPSQALGSQKIPVVKRFSLTASDAGKTIICTVADIMTGASNTQVDFDSAWIETNDPQPFVVQNTPIYGYSGGYSSVTQAQYISFNTAIASVVAEFTDGACQIADVATPTYNRSGTLNANITSSGGINFTITANDPTTFAAFGANTTFCVEGERLRASTITNNGDGTFTLNNVQRGEVGTTPASHASGKVISEGSWMSKDGVHPSPYGAAVLAKTMYDTFKNCTRTTNYTLAQAGGSSSLDMRANNLGLYDQSYLTLPTNVQTNAAGVAATMYAHPIYIPQVCIIQAIGAVVTTLNASSTLRFGLYGMDTSRSRPQYLIQEFGTIGGTSTGFRSVSANKVIRPGWYFLAVVDQGTVCTKRCIGASGLNLPYLSITSTPTTSYAPVNSYSITGVTGALPNTWSSHTQVTTALCPLIFVQVRSKHMG